MQARLLDQEDGRRTFVVVFAMGDEAIDGLTRFAREQRLQGSHFTAIGAFESATLAYWSWERRKYEENRVDDQAEVASLIGDIVLAADGASPKVHAHAVLGLRDGSARAGHLMRGQVRPTLEVVVTEEPAHLRRRLDPETGLALIRLE